VVLDEIGRGTSTFDGLSIAWAVAEYLLKKKVMTLFATHYHELTELAHEDSRVKNYNVAVKTWEEEIIFLYRLLPGAASESYGIQVAALAGLPKEVIERAKEILFKLEGRQELVPQKGGKRQKSLFPPESILKQYLMGLYPDHLSPKEALEVLYKLKKMAQKLS
jgi:DNA mismatch repair protein MutS